MTQAMKTTRGRTFIEEALEIVAPTMLNDANIFFLDPKFLSNFNTFPVLETVNEAIATDQLVSPIARVLQEEKSSASLQRTYLNVILNSKAWKCEC